MEEQGRVSFEEELARRGSFAFTNVGTSMMPLIRQGKDVVIITRKGPERCKKYDAVLYKRADGRYILHRIVKVRKDDYLIVGDNNSRFDAPVKDEDIIGVLTAVVRDGRKLLVTDPEYQKFVHDACDHLYLRMARMFVRDLPRMLKSKAWYLVRRYIIGK